MIKHLYCFRHGQTDWNKEKKLQGGDINTPLNETGIDQAKEVQKLINVEVIYTSPLKRAHQTAEIINETLKVPLFIEKGLKEISFGDFAGKNKPVIQEKYTDIFNAFFHDKKDFKLPGSDETKFEAGNRIISTLKKIAKNDSCNVIGICTHGRMLAIAKLLIGGEYTLPKNAEIIHFTYDTNSDKLDLKK